MAPKLNLEKLSGEIADRARAVFSSVVSDLDKLFSGLGAKLAPDAFPSKRELTRVIAGLRKSLDARLAALEKAIGGKPKKAAATKKKPATKKKAAPAKKATKAAARPRKR